MKNQKNNSDEIIKEYKRERKIKQRIDQGDITVYCNESGGKNNCWDGESSRCRHGCKFYWADDDSSDSDCGTLRTERG